MQGAKSNAQDDLRFMLNGANMKKPAQSITQEE
jgi:hypothetical protein